MWKANSRTEELAAAAMPVGLGEIFSGASGLEELRAWTGTHAKRDYAQVLQHFGELRATHFLIEHMERGAGYVSRRFKQLEAKLGSEIDDAALERATFAAETLSQWYRSYGALDTAVKSRWSPQRYIATHVSLLADRGITLDIEAAELAIPKLKIVDLAIRDEIPVARRRNDTFHEKQIEKFERLTQRLKIFASFRSALLQSFAELRGKFFENFGRPLSGLPASSTE